LDEGWCTGEELAINQHIRDARKDDDQGAQSCPSFHFVELSSSNLKKLRKKKWAKLFQVSRLGSQGANASN